MTVESMMAILCAPEATDDLDQLDVESVTDVDEEVLISSGYGKGRGEK